MWVGVGVCACVRVCVRVCVSERVTPVCETVWPGVIDSVTECQ